MQSETSIVRMGKDAKKASYAVTGLSSAQKNALLLSLADALEANEKSIIKSTNKCGRKLSITLISQSLNHFRDANPKLNKWYLRMAQYKKSGIVRMALCRRTLTEIYQMLKKQEYHYYRDVKNHQKKMDKYRKFLERSGIEFLLFAA